jgi:hypothetical protein
MSDAEALAFSDRDLKGGWNGSMPGPVARMLRMPSTEGRIEEESA